jgi:hypothetical protein
MLNKPKFDVERVRRPNQGRIFEAFWAVVFAALAAYLLYQESQ